MPADVVDLSIPPSVSRVECPSTLFHVLLVLGVRAIMVGGRGTDSSSEVDYIA